MGSRATLSFIVGLLALASLWIWQPWGQPGELEPSESEVPAAVQKFEPAELEQASVPSQQSRPSGSSGQAHVHTTWAQTMTSENFADRVRAKTGQVEATFTVQLRMRGAGGIPITGPGYSAALSWRDPGNEIHTEQFSISFDKEGQASIELPAEAHMARAGIFSIEGPSPVGNSAPHLTLGIQSLVAGDFSERAPMWTVNYATETLLAGRIVDQHGEPFANCMLLLQALDGDETSLYERLKHGWSLEADDQGLFRISAQHRIAGFTYEILPANPAGAYRNAAALPFTAGRDRVELVVERVPNLAGKILVDDPSVFSKVTLFLSDGPPEWRGFSRGWEVSLFGEDGEFDTMPIQGPNPMFTLYATNTGERLATNFNLKRRGQLVDGKWRLPDWDLRDQLFQHHVKVTTVDQNSIMHIDVTSGARKPWSFRADSSDFHFLSALSSVPLKLTAPGYREAFVEVSGEAEIKLLKGFPFSLKFDPPLQEFAGVQWKVCLQDPLKLCEPSDYVWYEVEGGSAELSVPITGKWEAFLRAGPASENENSGWENLLGLAASSHAAGGFVVAEEKTQVILKIDEDQLAQAIAELNIHNE